METNEEDLVCCVCGLEDCICESTTCISCDGKGSIVTCPDDMCHTRDGCIHGDGEFFCGYCEGEGNVYPKKIDRDEFALKQKHI